MNEVIDGQKRGGHEGRQRGVCWITHLHRILAVKTILVAHSEVLSCASFTSLLASLRASLSVLTIFAAIKKARKLHNFNCLRHIFLKLYDFSIG